MKIPAVSNMQPTAYTNKTSFGSKKTNTPHYEHNGKEVNLAHLKAHMLPKVLFDSQIRQAVVDVFKERDEVLNKMCDIKRESYKISDRAQEIIEHGVDIKKEADELSDEFYSYCTSGILSDFSDIYTSQGEEVHFSKDNQDSKLTILKYRDGKLKNRAVFDNGSIKITSYKNDDTINIITKDGLKTVVDFNSDSTNPNCTDKSFTFIDNDLFSYASGINIESDKEKSTEESYIFNKNKLSSFKRNEQVTNGLHSIDEAYSFDEYGFISNYQKDYSKSANDIVTTGENFEFKELGVIDSYRENCRYNKQYDKEQKMSRAMMFDGIKLKYYAKYSPYSHKLEKELTFDNGKLLQITIGDRTIPPIN